MSTGFPQLSAPLGSSRTWEELCRYTFASPLMSLDLKGSTPDPGTSLSIPTAVLPQSQDTSSLHSPHLRL